MLSAFLGQSYGSDRSDLYLNNGDFEFYSTIRGIHIHQKLLVGHVPWPGRLIDYNLPH